MALHRLPDLVHLEAEHVAQAPDRELYRLRNRVERLVNRLKQFRAVATRYDKTAESFLAFVRLAAARVWLKSVHTA